MKWVEYSVKSIRYIITQTSDKVHQIWEGSIDTNYPKQSEPQQAVFFR